MSCLVSILEQLSEIGGPVHLSRPGNNPNHEPTNSPEDYHYLEFEGFDEVQTKHSCLSKNSNSGHLSLYAYRSICFANSTAHESNALSRCQLDQL